MRKQRSPETTHVSREVRILNKLGLHARPAAEFVKLANSFRSEIWLVTATGRFSALSLIDVMRANLDCGAAARLEADGVDAEKAVDRLAHLLKKMRDYT